MKRPQKLIGNMGLVFMVLLLMIEVVASCKKKDDPQPLFDCTRNSTALDSLSVINLLLNNSMILSYRSCYQTNSIIKTTQPLNAKFTWNGNVGVYLLQGKTDDGLVEYKGNFTLKPIGSNWQLFTVPQCLFIEGAIKRCGDHVLFQNQAAQGCDNLYNLL